MSTETLAVFRSGYANRIYHPRVVVKVLRMLLALRETQEKPIEFDTLVGTGLSGSLIVPYMARALTSKTKPIHWCIVRKDGDGTHSPYKLEGAIGEKWLFVDDLIASGRTFDRCVAAVKGGTQYPWSVKPELTGVYLYGSGNQKAGSGWATLASASAVKKTRPWGDQEEYWSYHMERWSENTEELDAFTSHKGSQLTAA